MEFHYYASESSVQLSCDSKVRAEGTSLRMGNVIQLKATRKHHCEREKTRFCMQSRQMEIHFRDCFTLQRC